MRPYESLAGPSTPRCHYCGAIATQHVEVRADEIPAGGGRGRYLKSIRKNLCDECALKIMTVHHRGGIRHPEAHAPSSTLRLVG